MTSKLDWEAAADVSVNSRFIPWTEPPSDAWLSRFARQMPRPGEVRNQGCAEFLIDDDEVTALRLWNGDDAGALVRSYLEAAAEHADA